jgi:DMSO/TMAO reductase YedYZ molybdopterin-dependent catalytic subunit
MSVSLAPLLRRDGNRENITVVVTMCADGEEIPPTIIYKGQSFTTNWHLDNEIHAS